MSRVGARRERAGIVPRATALPRLAKPARHAGYAPGAHRSIGGCRRSGEAASLRRAGHASPQRRRRGGRTSSVAPAFAGRDMRRARVTERSTLASGPDPRCISGRPASGRPRGTMRVLLWIGLVLAGAASAHPAPPNVTLVALTEDGTLITFPAGHPGDASTARVTGAS